MTKEQRIHLAGKVFYTVLKTHDSRCGSNVGVSSGGIYCRPICRASCRKREIAVLPLKLPALGLPPLPLRVGALLNGGTMTYICTINSPIGLLTVSSNGDDLTGLWIEGQKYFGSTLGKSIENDSLPIFTKVQSWIKQYFDGMQPVIDFPLAPSGSSFRQAVWKILGEIPYGQVVTYGEIAQQIKEKSGKASISAQAVGGAVGHNPISIIIPCHRVVGSDGSLTGYAGGINKKIALLKLENVPMDKLYVPKKGTAL